MAEPEPIPVPEPSGQLVPPPRKPPTAIGLVEPDRPRPHPDRPTTARLTRVARTSRMMLGVLLILGGAGVALVSPLGLLVGGVAIAAGTRLIGRTVRRAA